MPLSIYTDNKTISRRFRNLGRPSINFMYTIYRHVRVMAVQQQKQQRTRRPEEIADPALARPDYYVTIARFDGVPYACNISDFQHLIYEDHGVSVAVDEHWNVIAAVNHTTGEQGALKAGASAGELLSSLFFTAIPVVLSFFIARKAWNTVTYYEWGWPILGVGVGLGLLIVFGVSKQYSISKKALSELLKQ